MPTEGFSCHYWAVFYGKRHLVAKSSVCLCPSVHLWPLQSEITFYPVVRWRQNLGPSWSGLDLKNRLFRQIYLLPGFWGLGVVSYLFGNRRARQKKCWEHKFYFWPTPRENGYRRPTQILEFQIFHKSDPCGYWMPTFLFDAPLRPRRQVQIHNRGVFWGSKNKSWEFWGLE